MTDFEQLTVDDLFVDALDIDVGPSSSEGSPMSDALWLGEWSEELSDYNDEASSVTEDDVDSLRLLSTPSVSARATQQSAVWCGVVLLSSTSCCTDRNVHISHAPVVATQTGCCTTSASTSAPPPPPPSRPRPTQHAFWCTNFMRVSQTTLARH
jgi:hypothetical protein